MGWMKQRDSIVAIFWIVLGFIISVWSATFPLGSWESIGPGILPMACGLALILFGMILLLQSRKQEGRPPKSTVPILPYGAAFTRVALSLGGLFLSAVVFDLLGFVLTLSLLILFLMQVIQPFKWRAAIFLAFAMTLSSHFFFSTLLKVTLPRGFLGF